MDTVTVRERYVPGFYVRKRPGAAQLTDRYVREWEARRMTRKVPQRPQQTSPSICFSRKIGVGALEIADRLAERLDYRVVDRQVLEHIAENAELSHKTVALFDEQYPGRINELLAYLFGEKSFIQSDYSRHLFSSVLAIGNMEPTIFVGRGAHLILPRERVLAVRFISSPEHRIKRLSRIMEISEKEAEKQLEEADRIQREFFRRVYDRKDASPYEFDLVINRDYLTETEWAAAVVEKAYMEKFGVEIIRNA